MRRTKWPLKRTKSVRKPNKWFVGMEYMANRFGVVKGPYKTDYNAMNVQSTNHHCIILKKDGQWFLTHRKNAGVWKQVESQKIQMASPS